METGEREVAKTKSSHIQLVQTTGTHLTMNRRAHLTKPGEPGS